MRWPVETARPALTLGLLSALLAGAVGIAAASGARNPWLEAARRTNQGLVAELGLTDLAIWSGATYCRHPSQADRFAARADHPMALEHFPAGSVVPPPRLEARVSDARRRGP